MFNQTCLAEVIRLLTIVCDQLVRLSRGRKSGSREEEHLFEKLVYLALNTCHACQNVGMSLHAGLNIANTYILNASCQVSQLICTDIIFILNVDK